MPFAVMITAITYVALCAVSTPLLVFGLTRYEASLFESAEVPVIPRDADLIGLVLVGNNNADSTHTLISNGIPDHGVGADANSIIEQNFRMRFPQNPRNNSQPTCLEAYSIIGFATNGVAIFSPFDTNLHSLNFDFGGSCQGRVNSTGIYYYAQVPNECSTFTPGYRGHDPGGIYGVALDGFPIYGPGEGANKVTNSQLDACHGMEVDGRYRYYMTDEWPYVLGCFWGTPGTVESAQPTTGVCRFACSQGTISATPCSGGHPPIPIPTQPAIQTPIPPQNTGLTAHEASLFDSDGIQVIFGSSLFGDVFVTPNYDGTFTYTLTSNGIPDHPLRTFPNTDDPYSISQQRFTLRFPQNPTVNSQPRCLPAQSIIGFAINGVPIFSPFDNNLNNLNLAALSSNCPGRVRPGGIYYYARAPNRCSSFIRDNPSGIYGVALDGFPIYGPGSGFNKVTNSQLDPCHGKFVNGRYGYYMTDEWPYVLGCFRGTPQYVSGAQSPSGICKFACNKNAFPTAPYCADDFPLVPPLAPSTPVPPPTAPPAPTGVTAKEASLFQSMSIQPQPVPNIVGRFSLIASNTYYTFSSNSVPDHYVGTFPNLNNQYAISGQNFIVTIPKNPTINPQPTCLPANSIIGFATNGVAIFSPFDYNGNNLNLEFGNNCQGRTSSSGIYYYAQIPDKCDTYIPGNFGHNPNEIYGVALDGFPIYGPGTGLYKVTNAELDACHGKMVKGQYRYYMTDEWPYVLGCFRGTPATVQGAPFGANICRFACNTDSLSYGVSCVNGFPIEPPRRPYLTQLPSTQPPPQPPTTTRPDVRVIGLTDADRQYFTSRDIQPIPYTVGGSVIIYSDFDGDTYILLSNGIPDHIVSITGQISVQNYQMQFPKYPTINDDTTCIPANSIIGFATNGVPIFSPFDVNGNPITNTFDVVECQEYVTQGGLYHYVQVPDKCETFDPIFAGRDPNSIYGVAIDGFPIYGPGAGNAKITNEDLDECHGKMVDGQYRYYWTNEWPYVLGCFHGSPQQVDNGLTVSQVCKFACNKKSHSNTVSCVDDFPGIHPEVPQATQPPPSPPPSISRCAAVYTAVGLTSDNRQSFISRQIQPLPNTVDGSVNMYYAEDVDIYLLFSNGIPDHTSRETGQVSVQTFEMLFSKFPALNDDPTCVAANSIIGFATNGVPIFSPFDVNGDPITNTFDGVKCQEYVTQEGLYHYVQVPDKCETFDPRFTGRDPNGIYGVAIDGFPIYGPGAGNAKITNADLDECHGKMVDGQYRYYWTNEWPYVLGCFHGNPQKVDNGPTVSQVCKFACKTDSTTSDTRCEQC